MVKGNGGDLDGEISIRVFIGLIIIKMFQDIKEDGGYLVLVEDKQRILVEKGKR